MFFGHRRNGEVTVVQECKPSLHGLQSLQWKRTIKGIDMRLLDSASVVGTAKGLAAGLHLN